MQLGIDDPRQWLDNAPDDVVTLWDAYYRLEPWGGDYQRHASLMELLEVMYSVFVNQYLSAANKYTPRKRKTFFPADYAGETPKKRKSNIMTQLKTFAAVMFRKEV